MRRRFSSIRYCPSCGADGIRHDDYRTVNPRRGRSAQKAAQNHSLPPDWICDACGLAFKVTASARWEAANDLFAQHRKQRVNPGGRQ